MSTAGNAHDSRRSGPGSGAAVAIFFGFPTGSDEDARMEEEEADELVAIREYLTESDLHVVTKSRCLQRDFVDWVSGTSDLLDGRSPAAVLWSAHGTDDGSLQTSDGTALHPRSLERVPIARTLRLALFSSCYTGAHASRWHAALDGHPTVVGWDGLAHFGDVVDFYGEGDRRGAQLRRLLRTYLLNPALAPAGVR